jgi:hypothetical protein
MDIFPMPELHRSIAISDELPIFKKTSLNEIAQVVNDYINEKDYSSAMYVMDTVDGLSSIRKEERIEKERIEMEEIEKEIEMEERIEKERSTMEKHDTIRKIMKFIPKTIEPIDNQIEYVRAYGIEKYICTHNNITCLRDERFLNAQLTFLASN